MSLKRIISESIGQNPIGMKEALSEILSEKIRLALEAKISQIDELSKETLTSYSKKANLKTFRSHGLK